MGFWKYVWGHPKTRRLRNKNSEYTNRDLRQFKKSITNIKIKIGGNILRILPPTQKNHNYWSFKNKLYYIIQASLFFP